MRLFGTPFTLIDPGQDPSDVQVPRSRIQWWHIAIAGFVVIMIVWPMINKPKTASAGMVTETLSGQLATVTNTATPQIITTTPTPTLPTPPTAIVRNLLQTVIVTVRETVIVPRAVEVTRQVTVPVEVTRVITVIPPVMEKPIQMVTVEVTREITVEVPAPTNTPWIVVITQIVEVTSTPTETPTPTETSTPDVSMPTETPTPTGTMP